jgi:hypothetical protein
VATYSRPQAGVYGTVGLAKKNPAAPRNPIQREKPRPVDLMLNDALDALDFPCVLASPSMPLSFTELPGEARWTPTPPDAPAILGKSRGRTRAKNFPGVFGGSGGSGGAQGAGPSLSPVDVSGSLALQRRGKPSATSEGEVLSRLPGPSRYP